MRSATLVSRFRRSHHFAARTFANVGNNGTPASLWFLVRFGSDVPMTGVLRDRSERQSPALGHHDCTTVCGIDHVRDGDCASIVAGHDPGTRPRVRMLRLGIVTALPEKEH